MSSRPLPLAVKDLANAAGLPTSMGSPIFAGQVAQANEDANRSLRKLEGQIAAKSRQAGEVAALTTRAKGNLDLFQAQYDAGQRQVIDVVSVYETWQRQQTEEVTLKYDALRLLVELARVQGVLADGDAI